MHKKSSRNNNPFKSCRILQKKIVELIFNNKTKKNTDIFTPKIVIKLSTCLKKY